RRDRGSRRGLGVRRPSTVGAAAGRRPDRGRGGRVAYRIGRRAGSSRAGGQCPAERRNGRRIMMTELPTRTPTRAPVREQIPTPIGGGVGESPIRPDGTLKVTGDFAYASDLWLDDMLWGATLRSPHPRARIRGIDITEALKTPGVHAVLTHEDVPGSKLYGLEIIDQPVLAIDQVRYEGEPVAIVAADHPETARRAAARITGDYEP